MAFDGRERVTHFGGVPTIAWQVIEHPKIDEYDLSSVESVAYGGAPAAPEFVTRILARFPKALPGQGWGMTETSATAVSNGAEDHQRKPATGVPSATGEAKIVGSDGNELPRGEVGELWYKGPSSCAVIGRTKSERRDVCRWLGENRRPRQDG